MVAGLRDGRLRNGGRASGGGAAVVAVRAGGTLIGGGGLTVTAGVCDGKGQSAHGPPSVEGGVVCSARRVLRAAAAILLKDSRLVVTGGPHFCSQNSSNKRSLIPRWGRFGPYIET